MTRATEVATGGPSTRGMAMTKAFELGSVGCGATEPWRRWGAQQAVVLMAVEAYFRPERALGQTALAPTRDALGDVAVPWSAARVIENCSRRRHQ